MYLVPGAWMPHEEWKEIEGFPEYAVSNLGNVMFAVTRPPTCKIGGRGYYPHILARKWAGRKREYAQVVLRRDNHPYYRYIHVLVAQAFIPNPDAKPTVNHKDGTQKWNNSVDNLEWATYSEQTNHGLKNSLIIRDSQTGQFVQKAG